MSRQRFVVRAGLRRFGTAGAGRGPVWNCERKLAEERSSRQCGIDARLSPIFAGEIAFSARTDPAGLFKQLPRQIIASRAAGIKAPSLFRAKDAKLAKGSSQSAHIIQVFLGVLGVLGAQCTPFQHPILIHPVTSPMIAATIKPITIPSATTTSRRKYSRSVAIRPRWETPAVAGAGGLRTGSGLGEIAGIKGLRVARCGRRGRCFDGKGVG